MDNNEHSTSKSARIQSTAIPSSEDMLAMVERAEAQLSNIVEARAKLMQLRIIENLIDEIESRETDLDATQNRPGRNTRKMPAQDANDLLDLMNKAKALRVEIENMGYDTQTLTLDELDTQYDQLSEKRDELKQIADDLAAAERPAEVPFLTLGPVEKAATEINEATAKEIKIHIRAIDIEIARNKTSSQSANKLYEFTDIFHALFVERAICDY